MSQAEGASSGASSDAPSGAPSAPGPTPTVAIVGRPNVGKSTLFNRLVGRRQAIVHDQPGVTRDRITAHLELDGGRVCALVDTGGLVPGDDPIGLNQQVELAVEESDLLVLVVDGREGLVSADETVWSHLRRSGKPAVLVVNKGDTREAQERFDEFHRLGIPDVVLVSAEHGVGVGDLHDLLGERLPDTAGEAVDPDLPAVAIVGRPNVGKSSLVNRIVGAHRVLVSPVAGTTRDPVDSVVEHAGERYLLVDTAGIRRRSQVTGAAEELAVMMARRQIERAQLAVLVVDAAAGITTGDLAIAGSIWELGRAAVVAVNKWDLLDDEAREELEKGWPRLDQILASPPRVNTSALSGRAVDKLFPALQRTLEAYQTTLPTAEVNRLFEQAVRRNSPPLVKKRPWKLFYATQVSTGPPTFMVFANQSLPLRHNYRRYLENRLRQELELPGVPIRLVIRKR
ncbi:MAG: ribosome biogenesis GTPase Der [Acidobacteriota bacterium]|nr:ribosome biogenesis GTPase Der [Acidobacteriota bacterium]